METPTVPIPPPAEEAIDPEADYAARVAVQQHLVKSPLYAEMLAEARRVAVAARADALAKMEAALAPFLPRLGGSP